jgi:hypothetical protein
LVDVEEFGVRGGDMKRCLFLGAVMVEKIASAQTSKKLQLKNNYCNQQLCNNNKNNSSSVPRKQKNVQHQILLHFRPHTRRQGMRLNYQNMHEKL